MYYIVVDYHFWIKCRRECLSQDATHKRIAKASDQGKPLPVDLKRQTIYYTGPSPARPGRPIGAASPTTSGRLGNYTPRLIGRELKGMIGKGRRLQALNDTMKKYIAVYLGAIGGAGALISSSIKKAEVIP